MNLIILVILIQLTTNENISRLTDSLHLHKLDNNKTKSLAVFNDNKDLYVVYSMSKPYRKYPDIILFIEYNIFVDEFTLDFEGIAKQEKPAMEQFNMKFCTQKANAEACPASLDSRKSNITFQNRENIKLIAVINTTFDFTDRYDDIDNIKLTINSILNYFLFYSTGMNRSFVERHNIRHDSNSFNPNTTKPNHEPLEIIGILRAQNVFEILNTININTRTVNHQDHQLNMPAKNESKIVFLKNTDTTIQQFYQNLFKSDEKYALIIRQQVALLKSGEIKVKFENGNTFQEFLGYFKQFNYVFKYYKDKYEHTTNKNKKQNKNPPVLKEKTDDSNTKEENKTNIICSNKIKNRKQLKIKTGSNIKNKINNNFKNKNKIRINNLNNAKNKQIPHKRMITFKEAYESFESEIDWEPLKPTVNIAASSLNPKSRHAVSKNDNTNANQHSNNSDPKDNSQHLFDNEHSVLNYNRIPNIRIEEINEMEKTYYFYQIAFNSFEEFIKNMFECIDFYEATLQRYAQLLKVITKRGINNKFKAVKDSLFEIGLEGLEQRLILYRNLLNGVFGDWIKYLETTNKQSRKNSFIYLFVDSLINIGGFVQAKNYGIDVGLKEIKEGKYDAELKNYKDITKFKMVRFDNNKGEVVSVGNSKIKEAVKEMEKIKEITDFTSRAKIIKYIAESQYTENSIKLMVYKLNVLLLCFSEDGVKLYGKVIELKLK